MTALDINIQQLLKLIALDPLDHPERAERFNILGMNYQQRYREHNAVDDLTLAIKSYHESVDHTPKHHSECAERLKNLGVGYSDRHRLTNSSTDLNKAIEYFEQAVERTPEGHPDRAERLDNLGIGYNDRYRRTEKVADLDKAIKCYKESVELTPQDDPERVERLNGLGVGYNDRYRKTSDTAVLDAAIDCLKESVYLTSPNHPKYAERLDSLAVGYYHRHENTGDAADLNMALEYSQASVNLTPQDHPERTRRLAGLIFGYLKQHPRTGNAANQKMATEKSEEAISITASTVRDRLQVAIPLLRFYTKVNKLEEAYNVADRIMPLIPLLTPRYLENVDKQHLLATVTGLASDSAAVALSAGKDVFDAIRFLELGRGVMSGSLTEMRTDVTALSSSHPELGQEFIRFRDLLDSPEVPTDEDVTSSSNNRPNSRFDAQNRMEKLLSEIRSKDGFEHFLQAPRREDVQNAAAFGAIVVVNVSRYRCDAILIEQHAIRSVPLTRLLSTDIEKKVRSRDLGSPEILCWLWDTIANPVLEALSLTTTPSEEKWPRIWWVPTGLLTKFPLHAAGRHLDKCSATVLDRVMSSYGLSIKTVIHHRAVPRLESLRAASSQALLVGVPNPPKLSLLPSVVNEIATVRKACESMAITPIEPGNQKPDIVPHLAQCKIFHFAGHGSTHANDPSKSYLVLAEGDTDPLTVAHLLETSVRDHLPFLAYLSACGTGQIKDEKLLDESIHLVSAFQLAGFRHVIGTLWDVRDEVCVDVARITYAGIKDGYMTDESVCLGLHKACRELRDEWLSAQKSQPERLAAVRDASDSDHEQVQSDRKAVVINGNKTKKKEGSLSWVPYVHYGV